MGSWTPVVTPALSIGIKAVSLLPICAARACSGLRRKGCPGSTSERPASSPRLSVSMIIERASCSWGCERGQSGFC